MLKIGVIGTGQIAIENMQAALKTKQYEVSAVYSRTLEKAKEFAQSCPVNALETDLSLFLSREDIDIVYIASPNSLHFEQVKAAIQANKHVVVEKPAVVTAKQWQEVVQLAKQHNVYVFEAIRHVYEDNFTLMSSIVSELPNIQGAVFHFRQYSSRIDDVYAGIHHNVFSLEFAGGALMDLGVYALHNVVSWFGMPEKSIYEPELLHTGVDGQGIITLTYPDFVVTCHISKITQSYAPSEIYAKDITYSINSVDRIEQIIKYEKKTQSACEISQPVLPLRTQAQWQAFASMIQNDDKVSYESKTQTTGRVIALMEQLRLSAGILFNE